jgi:hypothetical protein
MQMIGVMHDRSAKTDRRTMVLHAVVIAATPWLQLAVNPNLFVTPGGNRYIDPWLYTGFFLSLPEHLHRFPGTYYGSRLSWLAPGFLAHQAFSPLVANYVLHLTFFYALLAATYGLIAAAGHRRAAMFVTMAMAWNPVILAALSWDYIDGAGIVFITAALLCFEKSIHRDGLWWGWALAAGVVMMCMASSNLFLVVMWPLFGLFVLLRAGFSRWRDIAYVGAAASGGAAVAFLGFAAMNVALGAPWFFLAPQLHVGQSLLASPNPWSLASLEWLRRATWLVLPAVATLGALVGCLGWSRLEPGLARTMQVLMLAAVAVLAGVHALGTPVLQISYYASYLAPFALIALPLQFAVPTSRMRDDIVVVLELVTLGVFLAAHTWVVSDAPGFWYRTRHSMRIPFATYDTSVVVGIGAGVLAVVVIRRLRPEWLRWVLASIAFACISGAVPPDVPMKADTSKPYYETVVAAHRFIAANIAGRPSRIWSVEPATTKAPVFGTECTFLWGFVMVNDKLPDLDKAAIALLSRGTRLVLLLAKPLQAEPAFAALRRTGLDFDPVANRDFGTGDLAMSVLIVDLK